ncbi:MAG: OsmC family protein [Thermoplasmatota archaeon]
MGYELKEFKLEIEGDLDPRGVMGKADVPIGFQNIRVKICKIKGIPEEEIPVFLQKVQKRCPVDNTLEKGVEIEINR